MLNSVFISIFTKLELLQIITIIVIIISVNVFVLTIGKQ